MLLSTSLFNCEVAPFLHRISFEEREIRFSHCLYYSFVSACAEDIDSDMLVMTERL